MQTTDQLMGDLFKRGVWLGSNTVLYRHTDVAEWLGYDTSSPVTEIIWENLADLQPLGAVWTVDVSEVVFWLTYDHVILVCMHAETPRANEMQGAIVHEVCGNPAAHEMLQSELRTTGFPPSTEADEAEARVRDQQPSTSIQ